MTTHRIGIPFSLVSTWRSGVARELLLQSLLWLVLCSTAPAHGAPQPTPAVAVQAVPVRSFIVQLRDDGRATSSQAASSGAADARRRVLDDVLTAGRLPLHSSGNAMPGWQLVQSDGPLTPAQAKTYAAQLRADPRVAAVAPNRRERRLLTPNDPLFVTTDASEAQWWLQANVSGSAGVPGMPSAWDRSTGAPSSGAPGVVAVLDSGITSHGELNAKLVPGYDFVQDVDYANDGDGRDNDPADPGDALPAALQAAQPALYGGCQASEFSSWHGTLIAGQAAATSNNGVGVASINWSAAVLPIRVAGRCGAAVADIIDGMRWAAGLPVAGVPNNPNPARVITLSYGSEDACDAASSDPDIADTAKLYQQAIAAVRANGALVFIAAGNVNGAVGRPAGCAGAFAVASINRQGFKSKYSNFGAEIALATVGGDDNTGQTCDNELADTGIVSTSNLGNVTPGAPGYAAGSGTSFASPVAAGVASLMLAVRPALSVDQIEQGLKLAARPHVAVPWLGECKAGNSGRCACTTSTCGAGTLDAEQSLLFAANPSGYVPPARPQGGLDSPAIQACAKLLGRPAPVASPPVEPPPTVPPSEPGNDGGGGGGGAVGLAPLLGLLLAVCALVAWPPSRSGRE